MKTLYIIRHAKSSWDNPPDKDFDREIGERGKNDLKLIGNYLKVKKIKPDAIFSSPSKRTKQTIKKICKKIGYDEKKIHYEDGIYDNHMEGLDYYLSFLSQINDKNQSIFLVGHNPFSTELANYLLDEYISNVPTASVVSISFNINSWNDILHSKGKINFFVKPKELK